MKIALIDLNHMTQGVQTNTVALGIAAIAKYLMHSSEYNFDVRLFKNPAGFGNTLKKWKPDILGIAQYAWNSELNLYMAGLIKKDNPKCLIAAGGPNLYLCQEEKLGYLNKYSWVDLCVSYDGEMPFAEIVRRFVNGEKARDIRKNPPAGAYSIDPDGGRLAEPKELPSRLESLDVFGSMYADGFCDGLLDEGFHPFLETQRGCPFGCTYCHTGDDYYSRIIFQSPEIFRRDMEYLGKRFSGRHNIVLYMANTNFGLYKEDLEIARIIRQIQDKYDWPRNINVNSGNDPEKLLELLSLLKYKFVPSMSLQTLTPKVLDNIKRKNISFGKFVAFQKEITRTISENTGTELILSLPGETKESFLDTVSRVLNSGVQNIVIYTLMSLRGTPIASRETADRFGHVIRHRIVPRCFSEINGAKIFETEQVVVGTNSMPFEDYIYLRGLALIITAFASSAEMFPARKFLMECGLDVAEWIFGIHGRICEFADINRAYQAFLRETKDELFPSREAVIDFFSKQKNYEMLSKGRFGDNLLRKYKAIILCRHYDEYLELAFSQLRRLMKVFPRPQEADSAIAGLKVYLKSRDIGHIFKDGCGSKKAQDVTLRYDIPAWLACQDARAPLKNYKGLYSYSLVTTDYIKKRLKDFRQMNRDPELSLQILYRDGYIKDFWPAWTLVGRKAEKE